MTAQEHQQQHSSGSAVGSTNPGSHPHVWTPEQELAAKLVFGGVGCMIAVVFTHPVDVIKTRLQLQGEAGAPHLPSSVSPSLTSAIHAARPKGSVPTALLSSGAASHLAFSPTLPVTTNTVIHRDAALLVHETMISGPLAATTTTTTTANATAATATAAPKTLRLIPLLREIFRTEGPRVLMTGLAPAVLRESIYSTIRLGSYDLFKGVYSGMGSRGMRGGEETTTAVKLASGLTSGMIGSVIANPTDLIKVRLQAYWPSGKPRYASIAHACKSIYVEEGIPGLYRGVVPTAARAMVVTASQLASYDTTKHWLLKRKDQHGNALFREGYLTHFCASTVAGLVCSISTSPIDTVKVRYMNQHFSPSGKGALYSSAIDCAIKTVRNEGPLALYKGFLMCWLRLGPHTMMSLMIFEKLRSFVGLNPV